MPPVMMTMHTPMPAMAIGVKSLMTESMLDIDLKGGLTIQRITVRTASTVNKRVEVFFRNDAKTIVVEAVFRLVDEDMLLIAPFLGIRRSRVS